MELHVRCVPLARPGGPSAHHKQKQAKSLVDLTCRCRLGAAAAGTEPTGGTSIARPSIGSLPSASPSRSRQVFRNGGAADACRRPGMVLAHPITLGCHVLFRRRRRGTSTYDCTASENPSASVSLTRLFTL
jgi:hypothetical protein